ncbi:hypothetical protein DFJ73DRAFT_823155 [Zopfochytrium polystomum]|nr:hypothetical protein DFJ73DRAFT_823155 [Zopfochytrium polystomum]
MDSSHDGAKEKDDASGSADSQFSQPASVSQSGASSVPESVSPSSISSAITPSSQQASSASESATPSETSSVTSVVVSKPSPSLGHNIAKPGPGENGENGIDGTSPGSDGQSSGSGPAKDPPAASPDPPPTSSPTPSQSPTTTAVAPPVTSVAPGSTAATSVTRRVRHTSQGGSTDVPDVPGVGAAVIVGGIPAAGDSQGSDEDIVESSAAPGSVTQPAVTSQPVVSESASAPVSSSLHSTVASVTSNPGISGPVTTNVVSSNGQSSTPASSSSMMTAVFSTATVLAVALIAVFAVVAYRRRNAKDFARSQMRQPHLGVRKSAANRWVTGLQRGVEKPSTAALSSARGIVSPVSPTMTDGSPSPYPAQPTRAAYAYAVPLASTPPPPRQIPSSDPWPLGVTPKHASALSGTSTMSRPLSTVSALSAFSDATSARSVVEVEAQPPLVSALSKVASAVAPHSASPSSASSELYAYPYLAGGTQRQGLGGVGRSYGIQMEPVDEEFGGAGAAKGRSPQVVRRR